MQRAATVQCFPAVADPSARILILGSMPGVRSLQAGQYYAHPRNQFWPLMEAVVGIDAGAPYEDRLRGLRMAGIALWDVLQACERPGSLDSAIRNGSRVTNDFIAFFREHPLIELVCLNGTEADTSFRRHALPALGHRTFHATRLPSTSPAHATLGLERKAEAWRGAMRPLLTRHA